MVKLTKTRVVHCKREPFDIYIGRGSKWGNPFSHKPSQFNVMPVDTREDAINLYRDYLLESPELLDSLDELKGKVLGCYCKPQYACHGDVLVELLEG